MHYFSGFCLRGERELFDHLLSPNDFTVVGFSYGAIKALEYTLHTDARVDRLILLSPSFFNDKSQKFKKMQLHFFNKNSQRYIQNFLQNAAYPNNITLDNYLHQDSSDDLWTLLHYDWSNLEKLSKDTSLQIYLGAQDKIIDAQKAHDFFKAYGQSLFYKSYGHLLQ